jgi:sugar transferase (PEP-CTERM/EpsH1 system associated)
MKILVVLSRFPYPLEKGDKLRAYHQLRVLSRKHDIFLVALQDKGNVSPEAMSAIAAFCKEIKVVKLTWYTKLFYILLFLFKGLPLQCGYFYRKKARKIIENMVNRVQPDHIYGQMIRVSEYIKTFSIPKTIDYQDVLSKGMYRRARVAPKYLKPFLWLEYRRLMKYESAIFSAFDHHTIITGVDRDMISHPDFKKIHVIANGVDFDTFKYRGEAKVYDLIFTGNMQYVPNVDAAEYLVKSIFPLLLKENPSLKLVICGANPSHKIRQWASPRITVTGWVDSMARYYALSRIFIAPMQLGTGLQNKLLEAMAMQIPCITSPLAGKPLQHAQPGKDLLICNTATGYAESVNLLLNNPIIFQEIATNGYHFVKQHYNWEKTTENLSNIMENKN